MGPRLREFLGKFWPKWQEIGNCNLSELCTCVNTFFFQNGWVSKDSFIYVIVNRETGKFGALLETFRTIRCGMDFAMYPLDRQRCKYLIGSVANKLGLKVDRKKSYEVPQKLYVMIPSFQTYTSNMTETPRATETNNLPYDFEFGELDDDEVPDSEGQGWMSIALA